MINECEMRCEMEQIHPRKTHKLRFWSALNWHQRIPGGEFPLVGKFDINILLLYKLYGTEED